MDEAAPKPVARKRNRKLGVPCLLCGLTLPRLNASHLRTHGFTPSQYGRAFGPNALQARPLGDRKAADLAAREATGTTTVAPTVPAPVLPVEGGALARSIAEELLSSPDFTARLTDDVADAIFGGALRDRLRLSLSSMLAARLAAHGEAVQQLAAVRQELGQEWRRTAGGKDGGPTPTPTLLGMHGEALAELRSTEELLLRTVKVAVDEQKSRERREDQYGSPLDGARYSGKDERLRVPDAVPAGEREIMRNLLELMQRGLAARRPIQPQAAIVSAPNPAPADEPPGLPAPLPDATSTLGKAPAGPQDAREPEGVARGPSTAAHEL